MNPYSNLPEEGFWKSAVSSKNCIDISGVWDPKFNVKPTNLVATYGSCFAQHIGRALEQRGYKRLVTEYAPVGLSESEKRKFNYDIFSSRTGNIYTCSLLRQWVEWAFGIKKPPHEVWEQEGRYYDPFRPNVEPDGFESEGELIESRSHCIESFKESVVSADYFIFTMGLTESWVNSAYGYEYPMCPGTVAGVYDSQLHEFQNQRFVRIKEDLVKSIQIMRKFNPKLKFILTVSPVPLTATNSGLHVLTATTYSKSVLRAVAGELADTKKVVDYFPSYEIINSPVFRGQFFEPNMRQVHQSGVDLVMEHFFQGLNRKYGDKTINAQGVSNAYGKGDDAEICEEALLDDFSK